MYDFHDLFIGIFVVFNLVRAVYLLVHSQDADVNSLAFVSIVALVLLAVNFPWGKERRELIEKQSMSAIDRAPIFTI